MSSTTGEIYAIVAEPYKISFYLHFSFKSDYNYRLITSSKSSKLSNQAGSGFDLI